MNRGFTLFETLAALVLGSTALMLLASMSWIISTRELGSGPVLDPGADFFRLSRILRMITSPGRIQGSGDFTMNLDDTQGLTAFCCQGGKDYPDGPPDFMKLAVEFSRSEGLNLTFDRGFSTPIVETHTLFRKMHDIRFECLDREGEWVAEWGQEENIGIPAAVRVTVEIPSEAGNVCRQQTIILPAGGII